MRKRQALDNVPGSGEQTSPAADTDDGGMDTRSSDHEGALPKGTMASPLLSEVDEDVSIAVEGILHRSSNDEMSSENQVVRRHPSFADVFLDYHHSAYAFRECILYFLIYLCIAAVAYSFFEGWPIIDSLYFAVVTFSE